MARGRYRGKVVARGRYNGKVVARTGPGCKVVAQCKVVALATTLGPWVNIEPRFRGGLVKKEATHRNMMRWYLPDILHGPAPSTNRPSTPPPTEEQLAERANPTMPPRPRKQRRVRGMNDVSSGSSESSSSSSEEETALAPLVVITSPNDIVLDKTQERVRIAIGIDFALESWDLYHLSAYESVMRKKLGIGAEDAQANGDPVRDTNSLSRMTDQQVLGVVCGMRRRVDDLRNYVSFDSYTFTLSTAHETYEMFCVVFDELRSLHCFFTSSFTEERWACARAQMDELRFYNGEIYRKLLSPCMGSCFERLFASFQMGGLGYRLHTDLEAYFTCFPEPDVEAAFGSAGEGEGDGASQDAPTEVFEDGDTRDTEPFAEVPDIRESVARIRLDPLTSERLAFDDEEESENIEVEGEPLLNIPKISATGLGYQLNVVLLSLRRVELGVTLAADLLVHKIKKTGMETTEIKVKSTRCPETDAPVFARMDTVSYKSPATTDFVRLTFLESILDTIRGIMLNDLHRGNIVTARITPENNLVKFYEDTLWKKLVVVHLSARMGLDAEEHSANVSVFGQAYLDLAVAFQDLEDAMFVLQASADSA